MAIVRLRPADLVGPGENPTGVDIAGPPRTTGVRVAAPAQGLTVEHGIGLTTLSVFQTETGGSNVYQITFDGNGEIDSTGTRAIPGGFYYTVNSAAAVLVVDNQKVYSVGDSSID